MLKYFWKAYTVVWSLESISLYHYFNTDVSASVLNTDASAFKCQKLMDLRFFLLFYFPILEVLSHRVSPFIVILCGCAITLDMGTQEPAVLGGQVRSQWSTRIVLKGG